MSRNTIIVRELIELHVPPHLIAAHIDIMDAEVSDLLWGTLEPRLDQVPALLDLLGKACGWAKTVIREARQQRPDAEKRERINEYERKVKDAEAALHLYLAVWARGKTDHADIDAWAQTIAFQDHLEDVAFSKEDRP